MEKENKFRVGETVRVKSKEWYEENKNEVGDIWHEYHCFSEILSKYCGKYVKIMEVNEHYNKIDGTNIWLHDDWIEKAPVDWNTTVLKDLELKKNVTINVPNDMLISTNENNGIITINIEHNKEQDSTPIFKDGDIVYGYNLHNKEYTYILIFKSYKDYSNSSICHHALLSDNKFLYLNGISDALSYARLATEDEKQRMFDELAKQKELRWDETNLDFIPIRWRAEFGSKFWFISGYGKVSSRIDSHDECSYNYYNTRNYFQTEEEAYEALPKWQDFFNNLKLK